jgi:hypothetical protein
MDEDLKKKVMDLLCFMCSSARGCVEEPPLYGPLRIIASMLGETINLTIFR